MRNKPEVLAPANSLEVLKTAVEYGAAGKCTVCVRKQKTFLQKI